MRFCKKCLIPDTRPGIKFDEKGVCSACNNIAIRPKVNWDVRFDELKKLCDKYRRKNELEYDCIIAVSGGKDSHYQVYVMKELMNMNPLLITVEDLFTFTEAGSHNLKNINEAFGCSVLAFKPNRRAGKTITRHMFNKYGRPLWYIDRLLYTVPLHFAVKFNLPLVVYGENVSYEYGGPDDKETYSAKGQIYNNVAPGIDLEELISAGVPESELVYLNAPSAEDFEKIDPVYLSYFMQWNSIKNYEFAKTRGFKSLEHEWERTNHIENFNQIDSYGYLLNAWMKFPKYGHAYATDYAARWVRYGLITKQQALALIEEKDHALDSKIIEDFCRYTGYSCTEFYQIIEKHYNKDIFEQNEFGQWRLKKGMIELRRESAK